MNTSNRLSLKALSVKNRNEVPIYVYIPTENPAVFNVYPSKEDFKNDLSELCYIQKPTFETDRKGEDLYEGDLMTDLYNPKTGGLLPRPVIRFKKGEFVLTPTSDEFSSYIPLKEVIENPDITLFHKVGDIYTDTNTIIALSNWWKTKY